MPSENTKKPSSFGVALALLLVLAFGFFAYQRFRERSNKEFMNKFNDALVSYRGDSEDTISKLEQVVRDAKSPRDKAVAEVSLGVAYLAADRVRAVEILKGTSINETYPPYFRAGATTYALAAYQNTLDSGLAWGHLFVGDPTWKRFAEGVSLDVATRKAYEWSNTLYPTVRAQYAVALWYGRKILEDREYLAPERLAEEDRATYMLLFLQYLRKGDELFQAALGNGALDAVLREKAALYQLKATAHGVQFMLNKDPLDQKIAEESFQTAFGILGSPGVAGLGNTDEARLFVEYYYALFLSDLSETDDAYIDAARTHTRVVADALDNGSGATLFLFLKHLGEDTSQSYLAARRTEGLAEFDPAFEQILQKAGWVR